ncbi:MAG TPA: hypothetical protein VMJ35_04030 [Dongiaceae bacterium]|nr:hypothetical protein [Dongiaceae bacterium]
MRGVYFTAVILSLIAAIGFAPSTVLAQAQNTALGVVMSSDGGSIGNSGVTEGATVYSGDYLRTGDSGSLVVRVGGLSLQLEGSSGAHIYAAPYGAVVELDHGAVRYTTPGTQQNLIIVASDVRVTPSVGLPDFGRVSIDDPCNLTVYSQKGTATAKAGSDSHLVEEGKAYRVRALNEVAYKDYVSPDENDYHKHHGHRECPAPVDLVKGKPPVAAGQSRFLLVAVGLAGAVSTIGVWKALESPDRP